MQNTLGVGEEGVAALADEQPERAGLDGRGGGIEAHWGGLNEQVTTWLACLGVPAGGVISCGGLPAIVVRGEGETECRVR
jgi:hypothetical protein